METIYKYRLAITDKQRLNLPLGFKVLYVGLDPAGAPCVWIEVDTDQETKRGKNFYVVGTGNPIPDGANQYVGSFVQAPLFVWHVYI